MFQLFFCGWAQQVGGEDATGGVSEIVTGTLLRTHAEWPPLEKMWCVRAEEEGKIAEDTMLRNPLMPGLRERIPGQA